MAGQVRLEIVPECKGCKQVFEIEDPDNLGGQILCRLYPNPAYWWDNKECPAASHTKKTEQTLQKKKRVGQLKQQKQPKLSKKQQKTYARIGDR